MEINTLSRIQEKLFNISSNLHYESWYSQFVQWKKKHKSIFAHMPSYIPSTDAREAQEHYIIIFGKESITAEQEQEIKAYLLKINRIFNKDYTLTNKEFISKYYVN